jgi:phosphatidylserine/phosphatidylglycerophosphate/cardiolipin synthase-like enzyme
MLKQCVLITDVSMTATGPLVHSFSAHFVERWNFVKRNKYALDPRFERLPQYFGNTPSTAELLSKRFADKLHLSQPQSDANTGVTAQLCRSAAKWSQGIEREKSIQNAYIDLITHATRKTLAYGSNSRFYLHRKPVFQYLIYWEALMYSYGDWETSRS